MRAGTDDPAGSTIEDWVCLGVQVWELPELVLLGQSSSTAYSPLGASSRVPCEILGDSYAL